MPSVRSSRKTYICCRNWKVKRRNSIYQMHGWACIQIEPCDGKQITAELAGLFDGRVSLSTHNNNTTVSSSCGERNRWKSNGLCVLADFRTKKMAIFAFPKEIRGETVHTMERSPQLSPPACVYLFRTKCSTKKGEKTTTASGQVSIKKLVPPIYGWRILNHGNKIKNSTFQAFFFSRSNIFSAKIKEEHEHGQMRYGIVRTMNIGAAERCAARPTKRLTHNIRQINAQINKSTGIWINAIKLPTFEIGDNLVAACCCDICCCFVTGMFRSPLQPRIGRPSIRHAQPTMCHILQPQMCDHITAKAHKPWQIFLYTMLLDMRSNTGTAHNNTHTRLRSEFISLPQLRLIRDFGVSFVSRSSRERMKIEILYRPTSSG